MSAPTDVDSLIASLPSTVHRDLRAGLDAAVAEPERLTRLSRVWRSLTSTTRPTLARLLVSVLREPTLWLGLDVRETIRACSATLAFGVDDHGLLRCSDAPLSTLVKDACGQRYDDIGAVVDIDQLEALRPRLADRLPWLEGPGPVAQEPVVLSYYLGSPEPLRIERVVPVAFGALDLHDGGGFARTPLARGELAHVIGGRLVNLGGGRVGVHDVLSGRAVIVDNGIERGLSAAGEARGSARFSRFRLELHGRVIRIVDGKFLR